MILHCAQVQEQLGISRRAALKIGREMGAVFSNGSGRVDFSTTDVALKLWVTLPTLEKASRRMPLDPLKAAAVTMAAALAIEHNFCREKILRTIAAA